MSTITPASTTLQITAAYLDNLGYEQDDRVAMANTFVTAVRAVLPRSVTAAQPTLDERPPAP